MSAFPSILTDVGLAWRRKVVEFLYGSKSQTMHWQRSGMLNRCGNRKSASWLPSDVPESSERARRPHRFRANGSQELSEGRVGATPQLRRHVPAERWMGKNNAPGAVPRTSSQLPRATAASSPRCAVLHCLPLPNTINRLPSTCARSRCVNSARRSPVP